MLTTFVGQIRLAAADVEGALKLFGEALGRARTNGEMYCVPEILRLTGRLLCGCSLERSSAARSDRSFMSTRTFRS